MKPLSHKMDFFNVEFTQKSPYENLVKKGLIFDTNFIKKSLVVLQIVSMNIKKHINNFLILIRQKLNDN
jgi:hypothetical protein